MDTVSLCHYTYVSNPVNLAFNQDGNCNLIWYDVHYLRQILVRIFDERVTLAKFFELLAILHLCHTDISRVFVYSLKFFLLKLHLM